MSIKKLLFAISIFLFATIPSFAQVSGVVFRDFNGNGVRENTVAYNETGLGGVVVNAYRASGATLTTAYTGGGSATNLTGSYTITGGTLGQIRLEFIMPDGATFATKGANGGTTVMFPSSATQNLAVNAPDDYWDNAMLTDPRYIVPCYVQGTINGAYRDEAAVVSFKQSANSAPSTYTNTGVVYPSLEQLVDKTVPCKISEVGTVWGVAFNKQAQTYYMTSFAKRHSGEGPLGYGGIYMLQSNGGGAYTKATGVNLQGVTTSNGTVLDFGTITRNQISNNDNEIADGANTPSRDLDAYAKVGSMSYGDTDFYEKEQKLFAVNMFQQSLLEIDATGISGLSGAALGAKVKSYPISTLANAPSCTGGALKSWGLKIYKDVGYLGIVCNAATSQVREDLKGFVMSFDPKNVAAGLTKVLDVNLNYRNGNEDWKPWSSTWAQTNIAVVADASVTYAEPAISDIEFDENGAMILGLMNLQGHKLGYYNYYPVSGNQDLLRGIAHGDILLACYDPAAKKWNLENTVAGCGPNYTLQNNFDNGYIATGRGPALGEFFDDASGDGSRETIMGSFAKVMGTNNLITTVVDPFPVGETSTVGYFSTGGMHWYDINTGSWAQQARLYGPDDSNNGRLFYGKAFGLGDIESELTNPAIEIGNRIWKDTDLDGVQDAGEAGIAGVQVQLFASNGSTLLATATTDANGNYIFSNNPAGTTNANFIYNLTALQPNTAYVIKFPTTVSGNSLTTVDAGSKNTIDSDANAAGEIAVLTTDIPTAGANNHTFDVGYRTAPVCITPSAITTTQTAPTCTGATANNNGRITVTALTAADRYGISTGGTYSGPAYATATALPTLPFDAQSMIPNAGGTYTIRFFNGDNACFVDEVVTVAAVTCSACPATNYQLCPNESYTLTAGTGLTNIQWFRNGTMIPGATNMTYLATQIGSYSYTADQTSSGCPGGTCCPVEIIAGTMCCTVSAANPMTTCNDAGTGSTPNDDYFTVTLNPTGVGIGTTYSVSGGITANNVPYGSAQQVGGNFLISNGNLTITITDDASGATCQLTNVMIMAPTPCSIPVDRPTTVPPGIAPPCHVIDSDLRLGLVNMVDDSLQTVADDGLSVIPTTATPGSTLNLEMEVYNNKGVDAYLVGWIDWNGNGVLDPATEQVISQTVTAQGTSFVPVTIMIPANAPQAVDIVSAFRLSTQSGLGPYGETCAPDGEYENYMFRFSCPTPLCLPVTFTRN